MEKKLAAISKRYAELKGLARGQQIIINTDEMVMTHLNKNKIKDAKAQNSRWQRWENIILDPTITIINKERKKCQKTNLKLFKGTIVYTDGSKTLADKKAHWAYIIRKKKSEEITDRGSVSGTAQTAEVMAVLQAL